MMIIPPDPHRQFPLEAYPRIRKWIDLNGNLGLDFYGDARKFAITTRTRNLWVTPIWERIPDSALWEARWEVSKSDPGNLFLLQGVWRARNLLFRNVEDVPPKYWTYQTLTHYQTVLDSRYLEAAMSAGFAPMLNDQGVLTSWG